MGVFDASTESVGSGPRAPCAEDDSLSVDINAKQKK